MAIYEMERLGIAPIQMLLDVFNESLLAYRSGRGLTEKGDAGAAYLSVAVTAASKLASFRYPTLSAMAVEQIGSDNDKKVMTTKEAMKVIQQDPFCPPEVKSLDLDLLPEKDLAAEGLPIGQANAVK